MRRPRSRSDADFRQEIEAHLALEVDRLVAEGLSPAAARDAAVRRFGNVTAAQERFFDSRRAMWLEDLGADVRYALRALRRNPGFAIVAILTLALGIGANTAIFSLMHAVLLRPLPYADGDRIVLVRETLRNPGNASAGHFHDWTEQSTVFEATSAARAATYNLADGGDPERVSGMIATPGFFDVAHIPPALGRYLTAQDVAAGDRVVVLSEALWRRRFAADASIIGRQIRLSGEPYIVVGVAPSTYALTPPAGGGLSGALSPQLWTPLAFTPAQRANYGNHSLLVMGKVRPGVTQQAVQSDMERITQGIAARHPENMAGRSVLVQPFRETLVRAFRSQVVMFLASVAFVMLIGCVNVASLLLARATARRKEIATRTALGGGRWRIVRQLLTESLVLAFAGGVAAIGIATLGIRLLVRMSPGTVPRLSDAGLQPEVLLFALAITSVAGVLFGIAPAFRGSRADLQQELRGEGNSSVFAVTRDRLRSVLVTAEIAIAVVLLIAAGLFIGSAVRLQQVPLGFTASNVLTARLTLPADRYAEPLAVSEAYGRMLEQLRAVTGVEHAGGSTNIPMGSFSVDSGLVVDGMTFAPGEAPSPHVRLVTEGYLDAVRVPLLRGRSFQSLDMAPNAPRVLLINQRLARILWPGEDPLGKRMSMWEAGPAPEWREVVGVVGDVRTFGPDEGVEPEVFLPHTQAPAGAWDTFGRSMALVARTTGDPAGYAGVLRRAVSAVDGSLPLYDVQTMDQMLIASTAPERFRMMLFSVLAAMGLVLAAVGIYGVIAYSVAQRTREIGIRMALGAQRSEVLRLVLRKSVALTGIGIGLGLMGAAAVTRYLEQLLFGLTALDPVTFAAASMMLALVALLASYLPARRAMRVDPLAALRCE